MGRRSDRLHLDKVDAARARVRNRGRKESERHRRDARMLAKLQAGSPANTPAIMSWLAAKLEKPASRVTPQDIQGLLG